MIQDIISFEGKGITDTVPCCKRLVKMFDIDIRQNRKPRITQKPIILGNQHMPFQKVVWELIREIPVGFSSPGGYTQLLLVEGRICHSKNGHRNGLRFVTLSWRFLCCLAYLIRFLSIKHGGIHAKRYTLVQDDGWICTGVTVFLGGRLLGLEEVF